MKSPHNIMKNLLLDASQRCSTIVSIKRDLKTIDHRLKHEGLSFLTITLPSFLDEFMKALEEGKVSSACFVGWRKQGCLPAFLQGFTQLVFDTDGHLRENEDVQAIHSIRQICSFFKKVRFDCTPERKNKAFKEYVEIDNSLHRVFDSESLSDDRLDSFIKISRYVISSVFPSEVEFEELIPHHGPGSTAEGVTGNKKYDPRNYTWAKRLSHFFNKENVLFSSEECANLSDFVDEMCLDDELPVRVIAVPKTQSKPRIIAMEPVATQMCQQGIKDFVVKKIESSSLLAGHVNFTDQTINQRLSLSASKSKTLATLDLSSASDRIHKDFIYLMLSVNPSLRDLVFSTRSLRACVPTTDENLFLNKFASMGSALCFPMEALFFTILCIQGLHEKAKCPISPESIKRYVKDVYVYGDDIIIPTNSVDEVVNTLSSFGNVVSLTKSFHKGNFRESCGLDAYKGVEITPIYMRQNLPTSRGQVQEIISSISTTNQLFKAGFVNLAYHFQKVIESVAGKFPVLEETSQGLGWHFGCGSCNVTRFNPKYQRQEVSALTIKLKEKSDKLTGYNALHKCLLKLHLRNRDDSSLNFSTFWKFKKFLFQVANFENVKHLSTSSSFGTLTLKRRWIPIS